MEYPGDGYGVTPEAWAEMSEAAQLDFLAAKLKEIDEEDTRPPIVKDTDITLDEWKMMNPEEQAVLVAMLQKSVSTGNLLKEGLPKAPEQAQPEAESAGDHQCIICFEACLPDDCRTLSCPCRYVVHEKCINGWFGVKKSCPLCRLEDVVIISYNDEFEELGDVGIEEDVDSFDLNADGDGANEFEEAEAQTQQVPQGHIFETRFWEIYLNSLFALADKGIEGIQQECGEFAMNPIDRQRLVANAGSLIIPNNFCDRLNVALLTYLIIENKRFIESLTIINEYEEPPLKQGIKKGFSTWFKRFVREDRLGTDDVFVRPENVVDEWADRLSQMMVEKLWL